MHAYACKRCIERAMTVLGLDKRSELNATSSELEEVTTLLSNANARIHELESDDHVDARLERLEELIGLKPGQEPATVDW